ncbi:LuxR C-terminal-related transcriptional regulator [Serratia sp. L9]|uniref:LuxR C-terminal-related transcriptional regulator n=1 Tax=Serratia sp. L9 TaxID=3423946 RepID=UPI003D6673A3
MIKKKVMLQCSCNFTRIGLDALISSSPLAEYIEIVAYPRNFEQCKTLLGRLPEVDVVILTLNHNEGNLASFLQLLGGYLPCTHPAGKVVLMAEATYVEMLKRYFYEFNSAWESLDGATTLEKLHEQLWDIILLSKRSNWIAESASERLSSSELLVLRKLLDEEKLAQIAIDLNLNYKTISHYKRSALAKLGMNSLCPLVMRNLNTLSQHHRFNHSVRSETQSSLEVEPFC